MAYAAEFFRWYAEEGVRLRGQVGQAPSGANRMLVTYQPVGRQRARSRPWNFPAAMATRKIAPALAAGCTAVLKPAAETPLTALAVAALLQEAGLPAGVLNVVTTSDPGPVVEAMLTHRRTRMLSFTGSTEVGRLLLRTAADRVLKCAMELGGNAPFVVLADADVDAALEGAMVAKMRNGGQACTAANRFFVAGARPRRLRRGAGGPDGRGPGRPGHRGEHPVRPPHQRRGRRARSTSSCATRSTAVPGRCWVVGPTTGPGCFYPPDRAGRRTARRPRAARGGLRPGGPGRPLRARRRTCSRWSTTPTYGLVSYLYTADLARGLRLAERIESGMVGLNRGLVSDPAAPFGGTKQSGLGREGSTEGLLEFMEAQYVATSW